MALFKQMAVIIDFNNKPDEDLINLNDLLDDGWQVVRCDASRPGGDTCDRGKLVYILQK